MFASPGESPPYVTFISTTTQAVVSKLVFNGSSGLEACTYDPASKNFLINNDGTAANPDGELDVITASSVTSGAPVVSKAFPLGKCAPTGIALGPNSDVLVGCDPSAGNPLITLILDRNTGAQLASIPFGGVDQVAYDPASNRYFLPARHYVTSGTAASSGFNPQMGVIDGATRKLLFTVAVGTGAHSVAVDSNLGQVYVPYQPGAAAFPNGGISVFSTK
jgi:DNA-binding beta-propeller fold protein YncE